MRIEEVVGSKNTEILGSGNRLPAVVSVELAVDGPCRDPEQLGGEPFVPSRHLEGLADEPLIDLFEGRAERDGNCPSGSAAGANVRG